MQWLLLSLKSRLASSVMKCDKWDQLLPAFPLGAHVALFKSIFPFQHHLRNDRCLWHYISVCFLQQLSSQQEVALSYFCFLAVLACWALKLLPYPFFCQALSTLYLDLSYNSPLLLFFYLQHNHIKSLHLSQVCVELLSPDSQLSFHFHDGYFAILFIYSSTPFISEPKTFMETT